MLIAQYPPLPEFNGMRYEDIVENREHEKWPRELSKRFLEWFLAVGSGSESRVQEFGGLEIAGKSPPASVKLLDGALHSAASSSDVLKAVLQASRIVTVKGVSVEIRNAPHTFDDRGWSFVFDIGILFGKLLTEINPLLHYEVVWSRRKIPFFDQGLPALFGFKAKTHVYPPLIAFNCAGRYLDGSPVGHLEEAFNSWASAATKR